MEPSASIGFLAFYKQVVLAVPGEFSSLFESWYNWVGLAIGFALLLNKPLGRWLSVTWEGISPGLGVAILIGLLGLAVLRANHSAYVRIENERNEAVATTAELRAAIEEKRPYLVINSERSEEGDYLTAKPRGPAIIEVRTAFRITNATDIPAVDINFASEVLSAFNPDQRVD